MIIENKNPKIFIIAGKARAGKDTTASFIKKYAVEHNLTCINLQFSYYIKMYAKMISNWDGSEDSKPRTLLQQLGTEVIRNNIDNNFFINRIIDDIKVLSYFADIITISDARLPEELDIIKNTYPNSIRVHIIRPDYDNNLETKESVHRTEIALNDYKEYELTIINDGSLEDLDNKVMDLFN